MEPANPAERREGQCLYTSSEGGIDPGFLESKLIKHAFDGYPKVRTGQFSSFETQEEPQEIDYGLEETTVIQPIKPDSNRKPSSPNRKILTRIRRATASGTGTRIWYNSPNITRR